MQPRILVATDGSDTALGALRLARRLAELRGAAVEALSVLEPLPYHGANWADLVFQTRQELERVGRAALEQRVREQLAQAGAGTAEWPLTVEIGAPAPTIARMAALRGATLILLGRGRATLAERFLGGETPLRVMRLASVPVLAVPAATDELPERVLAAVDFTDFSRAAARLAGDVAAAGAEIHLAHVLWKPAPETPWVGGAEWIEQYRDRVTLQLDEYARQLEAETGVAVETHLLEGDPAGELLRLAGRLGVQLIAAGSHGTGFFGRILLGSVSTRLVRAASCSVLVVPPRSPAPELEQAFARADAAPGTPQGGTAGEPAKVPALGLI